MKGHDRRASEDNTLSSIVNNQQGGDSDKSLMSIFNFLLRKKAMGNTVKLFWDIYIFKYFT